MVVINESIEESSNELNCSLDGKVIGQSSFRERNKDINGKGCILSGVKVFLSGPVSFFLGNICLDLLLVE